MRRYRAALTAAIALTLMLVTMIVAGPAQAGGPTSVLLVVPGTGQTASLYHGDADYDALARAVGAFSPSDGEGKVDGSGREHATGNGVTLTWLIHDVTVWRVDRVYLGAEGGPWISTQVDSTGTGNIWDAPVVWHTAVGGTALASLLERLGVSDQIEGSSVTGGTDSSPGQPDVAAVPDASAVDDTTSSSEQATETTGSRAAMLGWGLGGLALGVALTLAAIRLGQRSRTAQGPVEDDQSLDVAKVGTAPVPDTAPWSSAEELQRR